MMKLGRYITTVLLVPFFAIGSAALANSQAAGSPPDNATGRPILDQFNTDSFCSLLNGGSDAYEWQQGVTAGITGQLTRIALDADISDVYGEPQATEISVTLGAPWQSGAPAWTTTAVLRSGWNTFDLTKAKIFVDTGDEFAIGIHGQGVNHFNPGIWFSCNDQYLGGDLFVNGSSATSIGNDMLFRTYVSPKRVQHQ